MPYFPYAPDLAHDFKQRRLAFHLFSSKVRSYIIIGKQSRININVKILFAACLFSLTVCMTVPVWAGSHDHPAKQADLTDPGYVFALAAANHFLYAWQTGDLENGMVQLSDGIRHSQNADKVERFFLNANANSNARAFEIERGHGHQGHYSFPVVLVTPRGSHVTRKFSEVVVVETGKNDWVVDRLP